MKKNKFFQSLFISLAIVFSLSLPVSVFAAQTAAVTSSQTASQKQASYPLEERYLKAENAYLSKFPDLQDMLNAFYYASAKDIGDTNVTDMNVAMTHTRTVAAIMSDLAKSMPAKEQKLAIVTALMHDVDKMNPNDVLTDPRVFDEVKAMVQNLKSKGNFKDSPNFFANEAALKTPGVGDNPATIHNLTSPIRTHQIMEVLGYSEADIEKVEVAIFEHSTQYWYFRDDIDNRIGIQGAWEDFYPQTVTPLGMAISDADNLSQLVPDLVIPADSKWRGLARNRWGGKNVKEEAHIIYYVLEQMVNAPLSETGRQEMKEYWAVLRPQLMKLMELDENQSPIAVLGIPSYWKTNTQNVPANSGAAQESIFSQPDIENTASAEASSGPIKVMIGFVLGLIFIGIGGFSYYAVKEYTGKPKQQ
jgi:hypothetical protein